ncbi:MAG: hypothetical protein HFJ50_03950 [Clostridia bacterium]|jgi:hypothetical protein|nr:hypothetical protein [Clostridia bacterium]
MEDEQKREITEKVIKEFFGEEGNEKIIQEIIERILGEKLRSVSLDLEETEKLKKIEFGKIAVLAENLKGEKRIYRINVLEDEKEYTIDELYKKYAEGEKELI